MKTRQIIFNGDMVKAILDERKTQTRRAIKPQPRPDGPIWWIGDRYFVTSESVTSYLFHDVYGEKGCPYGEVGDVLYVKETWRYDDWSEDGEPWIAYRADGEKRFINWRHIPEEWNDRLLSVWEDLSLDFERKGRACDEHWRPSIHMPRWAARILLEITDIRVERVQDISAKDVQAEGFPARYWFHNLWDSINDKRGYGWDQNPWVWVVGFKQVMCEEMS